MGKYTFKASDANVHYTAFVNADTQEIMWSWFSETPFGPKGEGNAKQTFAEYHANGGDIRYPVPADIHKKILREIGPAPKKEVAKVDVAANTSKPATKVEAPPKAEIKTPEPKQKHNFIMKQVKKWLNNQTK